MYNNQSPVTAGHYGIIRVLLGSYLFVHFMQLIPYGAELFSSEGILPASLSPLLGIIPNPLNSFDSPMMVTALLLVGALCGVFIAIGNYDRMAGIAAVVLLGWLYARNPLIANPSLPVVGWMLVAHVFLPVGAYGNWRSRGQPSLWAQWIYPRPIWIAAWILLAVAYSYSGYTKLLSPTWVDGSAISLVLENPLARDHFLREFIVSLPPLVLKLLTWTVLVIELLFVPLCFNAMTRKWAWMAMFIIQFGFLTLLNFADLTFPMLLIHALTFDRGWVDQYSPKSRAILFYDGSCAFCNGLVRFALSEDEAGWLDYAPLQGETFQQKEMIEIEDDSIAVLKADGETLYKSEAVIHCLELLGGIWILVGKFLRLIPSRIRNYGYDIVGRIRYQLAGKVAGNVCELLPTKYARHILP